jgi:hypothetical protein
VISTIVGCVLILVVLWDAFETVILPRPVRRRVRLTRFYYRSTWWVWSGLVRQLRSKKRREALLGVYGPLSLLGLLGLWAMMLIFGFGLVHYGIGSQVRANNETPDLMLDVYLSGSSFFTLGLGDVAPVTWLARLITVLQAGLGFGFLAIVIGYLPVLYQAFSRREVIISMLDARAGSPPTAIELLRRQSADGTRDGLDSLLLDWEHWSSELLETHISYPVLGYFRSQHTNQSWIAALTTILDASALVLAGIKDHPTGQARLTFAIARHTVVDLSQVYNTAPSAGIENRLDDAGRERLHAALRAAGLEFEDVDGQRLAHFRHMYEPYVHALSLHLQMSLPPWMPTSPQKDNWQATAWEL